jgi:tRNA A37 methylthiotransferase MiaB
MSFQEKNVFGTGTLYEADDLKGSVYCLCTACMSIWSEFLSWANYILDEGKLVDNPMVADNIVVLSCQVTDLAILNDLRELERLAELAPGKNYFIGGCLARRFDIELPPMVKRLDHIRHDYQYIKHKDIIHYAKPFWVKQFDENDDDFDDGRLFRDMYPLRVSVGCGKNCEYCTIRTTRGEAYQLNTFRLIEEFKHNNDVVLIADSPPERIIRDWCLVAYTLKKPISIRNIEPDVAVRCWDAIIHLAVAGLLKIFHSPIQSMVGSILTDMHRPVSATLAYVDKVPELRSYGVKVATNIITDYKGMDDFHLSKYEAIFDYVSWNPLWDGKWDRKKAEERFKSILGKE